MLKKERQEKERQPILRAVERGNGDGDVMAKCVIYIFKSESTLTKIFDFEI